MTDPSSARPLARRDARLLFVGGGPFQLDAIAAAKRVVREVWVVDRDPAAPGMALADHGVAIDFGRPELVVALAQRERFDGVMTAASDAAVPAVAACVDACRLVGTGSTTARRCRDKLQSIETLSRAGLRVPHTRGVSQLDAVLPAIERVGGFPAVLKPRSAAGGRGVSIVRGAAEVAAAFERAMRYATPGHGCLVQEFISTHSVGLEAFLWEGSLAAAFCLGDQYCEDFVSPIGHALPSDLDTATQARVVQAVEEFCRALGLRSGPFNFDLRYGADEVCLIEVNARLGGSSITPLIRTAHGVDLAEATALAAIGEDPAAHLRPSRPLTPCATRLFAVHESAAGTIHRPSRSVVASGDVVSIELLSRSAEQPPTRVDDWLILGHCLVRGPSAERAIALARSIADEVLGKRVVAACT